MAWWRTAGKEPLVHFIVLGGVLFALDRWRSPGAPVVRGADPAVAARRQPSSAQGGPPPPAAGSIDRRIVVDAAVRTELVAGLAQGGERPPTEAELAAEVERWIDEEVLYREAVARGLDRDDPVVHRRVAGKMGFVLEQEVALPEPSEEELRGWFEAHRAQWVNPARLDFTHVFIGGVDAAAAARADALLAQIAAGAATDTLGDRFAGGRRYRGRKLSDLAQSFGEEFTSGLADQPIGRWVKRRSRLGTHLVRLDRLEPGRAADFATARPDVRKDWRDAHRAAGLAAAQKALRQRYDVVRQ